MDSLLNEIRKISSSGPMPPTTGTSPGTLGVLGHPNQSPPTAAASNSSTGTGSVPAAALAGPTPEDVEQMVTLLLQMDELRLSDPLEYSKTVVLMGLAKEGFDVTKTPDQDPLNAINESLKDVKLEFVRSKLGPASGVGQFSLPNSKSVLGEKGLETRMKGKVITPLPGFVIKTKRMKDQRKIFINMCQHEELDVPSIKKKLDDKGEPVEGMNIPMSVGPARTSKDKSDVECVVYDVIVHPDVIKDSKDDATGKYRDFVCQLGIQCLEQKYKDELDRRYKLPKLAYLGDEIATQLIQDRKSMPKIEEISSIPAPIPHPPKGSSKGKSSAVTLIEDVDLPHKLIWICGPVDSSEPAADGEELPLQLVMNDYVDPVQSPPCSSTSGSPCEAIALFATVPANVAVREDLSKLVVKISSFRLQVKLPGFKQVTYFLPCAVNPATAVSSLQRMSGVAAAYRFKVVLPLDLSLWDQNADPGSKQWLITRALGAGPDENPYLITSHHQAADGGSAASAPKMATAADKSGLNDNDILPEDRFHIKLPEDVDKYTGLKMDPQDNELPEDRFHRSDASSSYYINQREESIKEKHSRHEKEKAERVNDPNVEYIDMDDFKAGGKFGPTAAGAPSLESTGEGELNKAREILQSLVPQVASGVASMQSNLWAELLD